MKIASLLWKYGCADFASNFFLEKYDGKSKEQNAGKIGQILENGR